MYILAILEFGIQTVPWSEIFLHLNNPVKSLLSVVQIITAKYMWLLKKHKVIVFLSASQFSSALVHGCVSNLR